MSAITETSITQALEPELPLAGARLSVVARGGLARVVCEQRFANRGTEPLHVTYSLPLPADAAVAAFAFRIGERRIVGEVDRRRAARERFEEALAEGRSAAILEQERSSLFTQELGNVPPGAEVVAEVTLDQPLTWTDAGEWEWRFPTTVMPRYLGALGRVPDAERVAPPVAAGPAPARVTLDMTIDERLQGRAPSSPSHAVRCVERQAETTVELVAEEGTALDRDVVVRWSVARPEAAVALETARGQGASEAFGLLTITPPEGARDLAGTARDLVVLLDTSGSMAGEPLDQARRVVLALVDTLSERDTLELVEFSSRARRWHESAVRADARAREEARKWLLSLRAGGSTEMKDAILEALGPVRSETQRQIVLVTDGAIGFESEVVAAIVTRLPAQSRLHTVGVGSAINRSLTAPAARAGKGVEIVIGLGEDPEPAAQRMLRRTSRPLVTELELGGGALLGHAPARLPDLFAGAPLLAAAKLAAAGGEVWVRGRLPSGERWEHWLDVPPTNESAGSAAVSRRYARELVEDLELELCAGAPASEIEPRIERLGLEFQIATRLTSWLAISEEATVDPTQPQRRVRMPNQLPQGVSVDGLGLRAAYPAQPRGLAAGAAAALAPVSATIVRRRVAVPPGAPAPITMRAPAPASPSNETDDLAAADGYVAFEEAPPSFELEGKVLIEKPRAIVVSVTVSSAFAWAPGALVVVEWPGGQRLDARVVAEKTTAAQVVAIGQSVRLWLEFDDERPAGTPALVRWLNGDDELVVRLAPGP